MYLPIRDWYSFISTNARSAQSHQPIRSEYYSPVLQGKEHGWHSRHSSTGNLSCYCYLLTSLCVTLRAEVCQTIRDQYYIVLTNQRLVFTWSEWELWWLLVQDEEPRLWPEPLCRDLLYWPTILEHTPSSSLVYHGGSRVVTTSELMSSPDTLQAPVLTHLAVSRPAWTLGSTALAPASGTMYCLAYSEPIRDEHSIVSANQRWALFCVN